SRDWSSDVCSSDLHAARVGYDTECAEFVTAFLHRDEGRYAALSRDRSGRRREMHELLFRREFGFDDGFACKRAHGQCGQPVQALRADDDVDRRRAADDLLAPGPRDATRDCDQHLTAFRRRLLLEDAQAAELRIDLLRRLLADVAGVQDDEVGVVGRGRLRIALARHRVRHTSGVVGVHLAAVGFDVESAGFAHRAVSAGFCAACDVCICLLLQPRWPAFPPFFYRLSAVRETPAISALESPEVAGAARAGSRPASAPEVMRRTASSVRRASCFRSVAGSTSSGMPNDTTTSIAPSCSTRFRCLTRLTSP